MAKKICDKIGSAAAGCARTTSSISRVSEKIGKSIKKSIGSVGYSTKRLCFKIGNLHKRIGAEGSFASYDEKQNVVFTELGKEVFYGLEDKKEDVLNHEAVKTLLKEARDYETYKQEIRNEINLQKSKMDGIVVFRRATIDLEHSDPRTRRIAVRVLKRLGNKSAIPYLTKSLQDTDPEVRKMVQETLHELVNGVKAPKEKKKKENTEKRS